jgi:hypothetical protein
MKLDKDLCNRLDLIINCVFLYYIKYETLHKISFIKKSLGNLEQENEFLNPRIHKLEARPAQY